MSNFIAGLITAIGTAVVALAILFIVAVFAGTLIWLIWPHVIPFVFAGLVAKGFMIGEIAWWDAVLLSWLFGILFKSGSSK